MNNSFTGFRAFITEREALSDKDKAEEKSRVKEKHGTEKSDYLSGLEREFGIKPSTLAKVMATSVELPVGQTIAGVDTKYMPMKFNPGMRGGSLEPVDAGSVMMAYKDGRKIDPKKAAYLLKHRHVKRKDATASLYDTPWGPAVAAAASGGAAAGGAAPPM